MDRILQLLQSVAVQDLTNTEYRFTIVFRGIHANLLWETTQHRIVLWCKDQLYVGFPAYCITFRCVLDFLGWGGPTVYIEKKQYMDENNSVYWVQNLDEVDRSLSCSMQQGCEKDMIEATEGIIVYYITCDEE